MNTSERQEYDQKLAYYGATFDVLSIVLGIVSVLIMALEPVAWPLAAVVASAGSIALGGSYLISWAQFMDE